MDFSTFRGRPAISAVSRISSLPYATLVLALATAFFGWDIVSDLLDGSEASLHLIVELLVFVAVSAALYQELRRTRGLRREVETERDRTARLSGELHAAMLRRFVEWGLSPSEQEVALLLIKGLSMKEISVARNVREKTVRQQATTVYAKAGCSGRHELAALFIEDLLASGGIASP